jgi:hypothetical protein
MLTGEIDNTNSCHLELYTILGEYDNAGFIVLLPLNNSDVSRK